MPVRTIVYTLPGSRAGLLLADCCKPVFVDGEVNELLPRDENLTSQALDINNDNWVVGTVLRENNGFCPWT